MELLGLALSIVGVALAIYAIVTDRKTGQQVDAIHRALVNSPDLRVEQDATGAITSIQTITGTAVMTLGDPGTVGTVTVTNS